MYAKHLANRALDQEVLYSKWRPWCDGNTLDGLGKIEYGLIKNKQNLRCLTRSQEKILEMFVIKV